MAYSRTAVPSVRVFVEKTFPTSFADDSECRFGPRTVHVIDKPDHPMLDKWSDSLFPDFLA